MNSFWVATFLSLTLEAIYLNLTFNMHRSMCPHYDVKIGEVQMFSRRPHVQNIHPHPWYIVVRLSLQFHKHWCHKLHIQSICDLSRWCFFSLITQQSFTYQTLILLMVASPRATHSQYFECNVALFSTKIHGPSKWNMNPIMNDELNIHHFASGSKRFWVYMY